MKKLLLASPLLLLLACGVKENKKSIDYLGQASPACFYSKLGDKDKAFKYLDRAADSGYIETSQYENDTDLANLKSDARWNSLRKKLR